MTKAIGLALIVLGVLGLLWGGFSYTRKEKAIDLGPIEVTKETRKSVPIPPVAGAIALVGGAVLLLKGRSN